MLNFYPGPSKVYEKVRQYMTDAYDNGILGINHRSPEFVAISQNCIENLKQKLNVPQGYTILFVSSATECWEIIAQSLIKTSSYHIYNGAFGEKWYQYTKKIRSETYHYTYALNTVLNPDKLDIPHDTDIICLTQNETSNGSHIDPDTLKKMKTYYPDKLIAIDATSSMAGIDPGIENGDIWYASVQKCFGLPAGLAIMICSPRAVKQGLIIKDSSHYNSFPFLIKKIKDFQTTCTPNVLNIYLLMRITSFLPSIEEINHKTIQKYNQWVDFLSDFKKFQLLIQNPEVRSKTVLAFEAKPTIINEIKLKAKSANIIFGNGYGNLKDSTLRIANFPAIKEEEINICQDFLIKNFK